MSSFKWMWVVGGGWDGDVMDGKGGRLIVDWGGRVEDFPALVPPGPSPAPAVSQGAKDETTVTCIASGGEMRIFKEGARTKETTNEQVVSSEKRCHVRWDVPYCAPVRQSCCLGYGLWLVVDTEEGWMF
ncbi:hypothetical protein Tco_1540921 [Tanacetum coccineum]